MELPLKGKINVKKKWADFPPETDEQIRKIRTVPEEIHLNSDDRVSFKFINSAIYACVRLKQKPVDSPWKTLLNVFWTRFD